MSLFNGLRRADVWLNEKLGGNKGETISSRLGRHIENRNCWPCRIFCRTVLLPLGILLDRDFKHCRKSINEKYRDN